MTGDQTQAILARMDAQDQILTRIDQKVGETNGRVRKLELWQARVQGATSVFSWVQPAVAAVIGGVIVAVVLAVLGVP